MTEENTYSSHNEYIFEIRYKPNPKVLDLRGSWAEVITKRMEFEHWSISNNRLDPIEGTLRNVTEAQFSHYVYPSISGFN